MHIPDGLFQSHALELSAAGAAVCVAVGGLALWRARRLGERGAPLLGVTGAFVFAAQMLNFPVAAGTSGHFLGAVLAAVLLGPLNAFLVMAVVLAIQCLVFVDGGLTVLGVNLLNMGLVGAVGGWACLRLIQAVLPRTRKAFLSAVAVSAWLSVVASASACAIELAATGTIPLRLALPAMAGWHALIGVGEAVVTVTAVSLVLAERPDLVGAWRGATAGAGEGER